MILRFKNYFSSELPAVLKLLVFTIPLMAIPSFERLFDQFVIAPVSKDGLEAISWLAYLDFAIQIIGMVVARSAFILFSKPENARIRGDYGVAALFTVLILSLPVIAYFSWGAGHFLATIGHADTAAFRSALIWTVVSATLINLNLVLRSLLMCEGKLALSLAADATILIAAMAGKFAVARYSQDTSDLVGWIIMLGCLRQLALMCTFLWMSPLRRRSFTQTHRHLAFFEDFRKKSAGEFSTVALTTMEPLAVIALIKFFGANHLLATFSIGYNTARLLIAVNTGTVQGAVPWLANAADRGETRLWSERLNAVLQSAWLLTGLPGLLLTLTVPFWMPGLFDIHSPSYLLIAAALIAGTIPMSASLPAWCQARYNEWSGKIAEVTFRSYFLFALPLIALFLHLQSPLGFAILGLFVPRVLREFGIIELCRRRITPEMSGLNLVEGLGVRIQSLEGHTVSLSRDRCKILLLSRPELSDGDSVEIGFFRGDWERGAARGSVRKVELLRGWNLTKQYLVEVDLREHEGEFDFLLTELAADAA